VPRRVVATDLERRRWRLHPRIENRRGVRRVAPSHHNRAMVRLVSDQLAVGQTYRERWPDPALAGLVSSVWIQRVLPGAASYVHRSIPNGSVELLCQLGSVPRIVGPRTRPNVEVIAPGSTVVGLRFYPGAAAPVLGVPTSVVVNLALDANELWGRSAVAVGERVAGSASPEVAATLLQEFIIGRLADAPGPDQLVAEAVRRLMPWRTEDVASLRFALHISESQLRRRCTSAIGLAPKPLHRMLRFQGFLALVQGAIAQGREPTNDRLALLAADAGYADQSHLTRECVRLAGLPPRAFLQETARHCGCGHDHEVSFLPLLRSRASIAP
jgi:AraC-like DNA-binding protein